MTYSKFKKELRDRVQKEMGDGYRVEIVPDIQNNGINHEAICIHGKSASGVENSPMIHIEELYEIYCKYRSFDYPLSAVKDMYQRYAGVDLGGIVADANNWTAIKDFVYPALLSTHWNESLLESLISDQILDLAIIYIIRSGKQAIKVTKELAKRWGVSQYKIHEQAMENLNNADYVIADMQISLLSYLGDGKWQQADRLEPNRMYVLTNENDFYGAGELLKEGLLRRLAEGRNMFIFPTSIHEVVLLLDDGKMMRSRMHDMHRFVNFSAVETIERLSEFPYYYDAEKDEIRVYN